MRGLGFRGLLKPYSLNQESASDGRPVFVVAVWAAGLEKQGFFSEASNGGMQVGRIKGALYMDSCFGITHLPSSHLGSQLIFTGSVVGFRAIRAPRDPNTP